jgi:hypothetical protein
MGKSLLPHQRVGTPTPSLRGNPVRGNISSITLSEENCWNTRRNNPNPQPQRQKDLKP